MRLPLALLWLLGSVVACDSTGPRQGAGHYVLATVNGMPVPFTFPPSLGSYAPSFTAGDLVLRDDGTFALGLWTVSNGTWTARGTQIVLSSTATGGQPSEGVIDGDSVVITFPGSVSPRGPAVISPDTLAMRLAFRRPSGPEPAVTSGTWTLTAINGRGEPLVPYDTVVGGRHYRQRILYDSLTLMDGAFFRRHMSEETEVNGSVMESSEYNTWGGLRGRPDSLLLTFYLPPSATTTDRLALEQQQLVRRTRFTSGALEERYTRR